MPSPRILVKAAVAEERCEFCGDPARYSITRHPHSQRLHSWDSRLVVCQACGQQLRFGIAQSDRRMTGG